MARKRYLELPGLRAHYDEAKDRVVLTSTSPKLKTAGFKVPLEQNTRSDRAVRGLLETAGIIRHEPPTVKVNWNDDKCIAIAGKDGIGKTAFGSILASALSDIGKKVLLIDTVAGTDRTFRFTPHRSERPLEAMPELEYAETNHGWSVILAPETPEAKASFQSKTTEVHLFMEKLKSIYDVLIFDTSEGFLRGCEYSPFLRHFSNILLLAHPYRQGDEQAREFIGRLPQAFAVNSLSTGAKWQESPYRETSKYFGSWPHMQDFYRLDNDALLSRGEPLALMHREILPHLPLAFRP